MEINVDNLMKELRLVEGSQKMIAVALKMEEVPLPVIEKGTGFDKKAVYRLYNQLSSRLTSKLLIEVKRAVLYASIKFKVYKCLGVVVVTMENRPAHRGAENPPIQVPDVPTHPQAGRHSFIHGQGNVREGETRRHGVREQDFQSITK